jgi:hypothetical protein
MSESPLAVRASLDLGVKGPEFGSSLLVPV